MNNFSEKLSTDNEEYPQKYVRTCVLMHKMWITCGKHVIYLYIVACFTQGEVYK